MNDEIIRIWIEIKYGISEWEVEIHKGNRYRRKAKKEDKNKVIWIINKFDSIYFLLLKPYILRDHVSWSIIWNTYKN